MYIINSFTCVRVCACECVCVIIYTMSHRDARTENRWLSRQPNVFAQTFEHRLYIIVYTPHTSIKILRTVPITQYIIIMSNVLVVHTQTHR